MEQLFQHSITHSNLLNNSIWVVSQSSEINHSKAIGPVEIVNVCVGIKRHEGLWPLLWFFLRAARRPLFGVGCSVITLPLLEQPGDFQVWINTSWCEKLTWHILISPQYACVYIATGVCVCVSAPNKYIHMNCSVKWLLAQSCDKVTRFQSLAGCWCDLQPSAGRACPELCSPCPAAKGQNEQSVFPDGISWQKLSPAEAPTSPELPAAWESSSMVWFPCSCCFPVLFSLCAPAHSTGGVISDPQGTGILLSLLYLISLCMDGAFIPLLDLCKGHRPTRGCSQTSVTAQHCIIPHSSASSPKSSLQPLTLAFGTLRFLFCAAGLTPSAWADVSEESSRPHPRGVRLWFTCRWEHSCICGHKSTQPPGKTRVQTYCWPLFASLSSGESTQPREQVWVWILLLTVFIKHSGMTKPHFVIVIMSITGTRSTSPGLSWLCVSCSTSRTGNTMYGLYTHCQREEDFINI